MDLIPAFVPFEIVEAFAATPHGMVLLPLAFFLLTATLTGFAVPGSLVPMSFASGLLFGPTGVFLVAAGAALGAQALFLTSRHFFSDWARNKLGDRLAEVEAHLGRRGPIYVVLARASGIPGLVVTAGSALTPISARSFAAASLLGMLPAICLAAFAGAAI